MKRKLILIVWLFPLLLAGFSEATAGAPGTGNKKLRSINEQIETAMKSNLILTIACAAILTLGLQAAIAQADGISDNGKYLLKRIAHVKNDVENGTITRESVKLDDAYESNEPKDKIVEAFSKKRRDAVINTYGANYYNDADKKAIEAAYADLAKAASKKNLVYETPLDPILQFVLNEITETIQTVDSFDPKTMAFTARYEWIFRAISGKEREKWAKDFFKSQEDQKPRFYKELDKLAASCTKKLSIYKPNGKNFANRNAAEEALMKKQLDDPSNIQIHQIGLAYATWEIQKNNFDVPEKRFKRGFIWGKDSRDDFSYCRLYQVNVIQDYIGGGKYGETYAVYIDSWAMGCP